MWNFHTPMWIIWTRLLETNPHGHVEIPQDLVDSLDKHNKARNHAHGLVEFHMAMWILWIAEKIAQILQKFLK